MFMAQKRVKKPTRAVARREKDEESESSQVDDRNHIRNCIRNRNQHEVMEIQQNQEDDQISSDEQPQPKMSH